MTTPAEKKKQYVKTPEYRRSALKYSAFVLILGVLLSSLLAFLIHRAESRRGEAPSIHKQNSGDVQEPSTEVVP